MNPYETAMTLPAIGASWVPGATSNLPFGSESIAGQLHPFVGGAIEAMSGKDLYFGTPINEGNPGKIFLDNQLALPPLQLAQKLIENRTGVRSTQNTSRPVTLANYLGLSLVDPRWAAVWGRGRDEAQENYGSPAAIQWLNPPAQAVSP